MLRGWVGGAARPRRPVFVVVSLARLEPLPAAPIARPSPICRVRRVSRTLVAALLCMLLVALPVQAAPHAGTRTITIRLISTPYSAETIVDRAPKHLASKGDVIVTTSFLRNAIAQLGRPKGAVVGGDSATFTILTSTHADLSVEMSLPGGTLRAGGRVRLGHVQTYPVTGGTGRFAHARGTGESRALASKWGSSNRRLKVYRVRLR